jgi:hypothetical protein
MTGIRPKDIGTMPASGHPGSDCQHDGSALGRERAYWIGSFVPKADLRFGRTPRTLDQRAASGEPILLQRMKIIVDSVECKCWHEVGHATACLHLRGGVDCIEFLDGDARGHMRALRSHTGE